MTEIASIQIVYLLGWLILAASALTAYRLSWKKGIRYALIWAALFGLVFLVFSAIGE